MISGPQHISESEYLAETAHTNRMLELVDGRMEAVPPPTYEHQMIVLLLVTEIRSYAELHDAGEGIMGPLRVRLGNDNFRQPDVMFMLQRNITRAGNEFWDGADLLMEVVSNDDPKRDLEVKRRDYAEAGIPEYWIVDPRNKTITVLRLEGKQYVTHVQAVGVGNVQSLLLPGFVVDAASVFAAGRQS
jgi:Uma2 family endonuclease